MRAQRDSHNHVDWPMGLAGRQRDAIAKLCRWLIAELCGDPFTLDVLLAAKTHPCDTLETFALMLRHRLVAPLSAGNEFALASRVGWLVRVRKLDRAKVAPVVQVVASAIAVESVRIVLMGRQGSRRSVRFDGVQCLDARGDQAMPGRDLLVVHNPGHQLAAIALSHKLAAVGYPTVRVLSEMEYDDSCRPSRTARLAAKLANGGVA